jgi:hypothetical protein
VTNDEENTAGEFRFASLSTPLTYCIPAASDVEGRSFAVTNDGENTAGKFRVTSHSTPLIYCIPVASTNIRPRRSGAHKSYAPDHGSDREESSGSDSDWAALEEKRKKAERAADPPSPPRLTAEDKQKGKAVGDDHDDHTERSDEEDNSEYERDVGHKAGRLPKEGILKAQEFGKRVEAEATAIGKEFGKHRRMILIEAGLAKKATRKESSWNQHQAWFKTVAPPSKEGMLY